MNYRRVFGVGVFVLLYLNEGGCSRRRGTVFIFFDCHVRRLTLSPIVIVASNLLFLISSPRRIFPRPQTRLRARHNVKVFIARNMIFFSCLTAVETLLKNLLRTSKLLPISSLLCVGSNQKLVL